MGPPSVPVLSVLLDMLLVSLPLSQLSLLPPLRLKFSVPKSDLSGLYTLCAVSDFLRHTSCTVTGRWGSSGCCYSQVRGTQAMSSCNWLQFVVITYKTSGSSTLLNAFKFKFVVDLVGS